MTGWPTAAKKQGNPFAHLPPPPQEIDLPDPEPSEHLRSVTALLAPNGTETVVMAAGFGEGSHHLTIHAWPPNPPVQAVRPWVFDGPSGNVTIPGCPERVLLKLTVPSKKPNGTPTGWETGWVAVRDPHAALPIPTEI